MDIQQLESEIAGQLGYIQGVTGLQIQVVAQRQKDYKKAFENPTITVMMRDVFFDKPQDIGQANQYLTATFEIVLQSRWLRSETGKTGIYELYNKSREVLLGFAPAKFDKLFAVDFKFENYEENVFTYCFVVAARCLAVENIQDPNQDFPRVTQITYLDN